MDKDREITVMGIVNLTDDSFFSGSRMLGKDGRLDPIRFGETVGKMAADGAGIIDLGPCSSRPGSEPVGAEEEWRRLKPALEIMKKDFPDLRISVDTYWTDVVSKTYDMTGPFMVNDITAGSVDSGLLPMVSRLGLEYVAMHGIRGLGSRENGRPRVCGGTEFPSPEGATAGITGKVMDFFMEFSKKARIDNWILDPGFGFGKTVEENYQLLGNLHELKRIGRKILVGVSRKSMIYKPLGIKPEEALTPTQTVHLEALRQGADILRVHDVRETVQTIALYRLMG